MLRFRRTITGSKNTPEQCTNGGVLVADLRIPSKPTPQVPRQQYFNKHELMKAASIELPPPTTRIYGAVVRKGRGSICTIFPVSPSLKITQKLSSELIKRVHQNGHVGTEVERVIPRITESLNPIMVNQRKPKLKQLEITEMFATRRTSTCHEGQSAPSINFSKALGIPQIGNKLTPKCRIHRKYQ